MSRMVEVAKYLIYGSAATIIRYMFQFNYGHTYYPKISGKRVGVGKSVRTGELGNIVPLGAEITGPS